MGQPAAHSRLMMGPEAQYRDFLNAGQFMLQRSKSSSRYNFYPRVAIPGTGERDLEWVPASGNGTVYAITVNRSRDGSSNIALIDLEEGPRLMSRIEGVETLPIGSRVRARIIEEAGEKIVVFDPAPAA